VSRILIIGQAPSRDGRDRFAGKSGDRIARFCGLQRGAQLLEFFDVENLLPAYVGATATGDRFPVALARERAAQLRSAWSPDRPVILVGRGVARAFGLDFPYFQWRVIGGGIPVAVVPHPSGRNRYWNQASHRIAAWRFWRNAMGYARDGSVA
jgi:uracil-DNA glycosylase